MSGTEGLSKFIKDITDMQNGFSSVVTDMEDDVTEVIIMENKDSGMDTRYVKEDPILKVIKEAIDVDNDVSKDKQSAIKILHVLTGESGAAAVNHLKSKIKAGTFNFGRVKINLPYVEFSFKKSEDGINFVKIIYNKSDDNYTVQFTKSDGINSKHETSTNIGSNQLRNIFNQRTGYNI